MKTHFVLAMVGMLLSTGAFAQSQNVPCDPRDRSSECEHWRRSQVFSEKSIRLQPNSGERVNSRQPADQVLESLNRKLRKGDRFNRVSF